MQCLDKNEIYYIGDLNKNQLEILLDWLKKNDTGWEDYSIKGLEEINGTDSLIYESNGWGWVGNGLKTKNAKELFQELNKWYKYDDGSLFYVTSECKKGHLYGYGFDSEGSWKYYIDEGGDRCVFNNVAKNYKTPATKEEVEERLKQEAIKRGFVVGAEVISLDSALFRGEIEEDCYYLDGYRDEVFWNEFWVDTFLIMKDGVWLGIGNKQSFEEVSLREKESKNRNLKVKKTLKYLLKKDIILTPKQYKKLWKK